MQTQHVAPQHLEQIKRALGSKFGTQVSEQDIVEELQKYLDYGVPADQAVRTILRHHGIGPQPGAAAARPAVPATSEPVPLAQLPPASPFVNLRARILSLSSKDVSARGETKTILQGLLGDASGTAPFTSWRPLEGLARGDAIEAKGAYTKEFKGAAQVNFGERTTISKLPDDAVGRAPPPPTQDVAVGALREGQRGVRVTGRILSVAARQVTVQGQPKTVWSGVFADATGKVEFSDWHDHGLQPGAALTIDGAYVRGFRGQPQLTFDEGAKVAPADGVPPVESILASQPATLVRDLVARGGGSDITLTATLLEVRPGSGLVLRCGTRADPAAPPCGRVLAMGMCRIHGKSDGVPDIRVKGILDDGTGALSVVAGRDATEALLGKTLEQCKKEAQDAFRPDIIHEQLKERLAGRRFTVRGNVMSDDYGLMLIARSMVVAQDDTAAAAAGLLTRLEVA